MDSRDDIEEIFEFRIEFLHDGSIHPSTRHFNCVSVEAAREMFRFVCRKEEIEAEIVSVEVWNRWADRWETPTEVVSWEIDSILTHLLPRI